MNKYLLAAKGFFGLPFSYVVQANNQAEALEAGKKLMEKETEFLTGNVERSTHGGLRVVKKIQKHRSE